MTIRLENLTIDSDARTWMDATSGRDVLLDETRRMDLLSMVRHIVRDEHRVNMIPVVVGARLLDTPNQWGHDLQVEVQYNTCGWRAIYAARTGTHLTDVQCYMD